jgi:Tol biopolymer transport system component
VLSAISPSGRYLTYWGWETGNLVLRDLKTGEKRPLTSEGTEGDENVTLYQSAGISAWSTDGKQIAYVWNISGSDSRHIELRVVDFDGTKPRILFQDFEISEIVSLDWSPDGRYIVALALQREGLPQIMLVSTLDGSTRALTDLKVEIYPTIVLFSPDSRHVVYDRLPDVMSPERDIYLMDIESGEETQLIQHPADDYLLGWSADGQWLVFASDRTGALGLWIASVAGTKIHGEPKLVKPGIDRIVPIGLAHEGTLFYGVVRATEDIFAADLDPSTGKVVSPPGKLIESFEGGNFTPCYSSDGKYLAYVSRRGNSPYPTNVGNALSIRSLETREERVFYKEIWRLGLRYIGGPRWSPDGKFIVFGGSTGISISGDYRIDLQTGEITCIYLCGPNERLVGGAYGPDEKYFSARVNSGTGISQIVVHDLLSGEERELFRYPRVERTINIAISPDGRWLSFLNAGWGGTRSLNIMPASGGDVKEIWSFGETKQGMPTYNHTWSPDGRYILFSANDTTKMQVWDLWRVPVEGGKPEKMGLQRTWGIIHLTVRPDGRQLAFAGRGGSSMDSELWVLENFLPTEKIEESAQFTMRKLDYAQLSYPYAEISPDGKKIAYYIAGQTKKGIGILDLESGTSKVLIESGAGGQASKVWSPQSNKIAYRLNNKEIHICDIDGAKTQLFYKSPEYKLYPTDWSRDGKKILCFLEAEDRTMRIGTIAVDGQVKVLASGNQTEFVSEPKLSPDGNYVAFSRKDEKGNSDIYLLTSDGNQQEIIASHPGRDECPVWSPDRTFITSRM